MIKPEELPKTRKHTRCCHVCSTIHWQFHRNATHRIVSARSTFLGLDPPHYLYLCPTHAAEWKQS